MAVCGVAGGIMLHLSIGQINTAVLNYFRESITSVAGQASLFVSAGVNGFDEKSVTEKVEKVPGVKFAVPIIEARTYVVADRKTTETLLIWGVDLLKEKNVRSYRATGGGGESADVIEDPLEFFNQADSLIIPKVMAKRLNLKVESKLKLSTASGSKEFVIRGLLDDSSFSKAFGGTIGIMDISAAQYTFGKENKLDRLDIVVAPDASIDEVAQRLNQVLGPGFTVERPSSRAERTEKLIASYQYMLSFLGSLALIVGLILIYAMVSRFVAERRQELGTYRALGATRTQIMSGCLILGVVQGLLGGALGAALATPFANQLLHGVADSISGQFLLTVSIDQVPFSAGIFPRALLEGALVAAIAAFYPAWRASRVLPLEAMRKDTGESGLGPGGVKLFTPRLLVGLAMTALGAAFLVVNEGRYPAAIDLSFQFLLIVGAVLTVSSLNAWTAQWAAKALGWGVGRLPRLGFENIVRSPSQAAQNAAVVSVGLMILCIFQGAAGSFKESVKAWAGRPVYWELGVVSAGDIASYSVQPLKAEVGELIKKIPGVEKPAGGKIFGARMILTQADGREIRLEAYDDPGVQSIRETLFLSEDSDIGARVTEMFTSEEVLFLASTGFLRHSKKSVGDTVDVPAAGGFVTGKIIGTVNDFTVPGGSLYMDRAKYEKIWKDDLVTVFGVKAAAGHDVDQVRRDIDSKLARDKDLVVIKSAENKELIGAELDRSLAFLDTLLFAVLAVVMISLINTFLISVLERRREIGMLRAVGTSRLQLSSILIFEYVGLGLICGAFTFALGIPIAYILVRHSLSNLLGWTLMFHFPVAGMVKIAVGSIAVSVAAGLIPIWHAARIRITEALRHE